MPPSIKVVSRNMALSYIRSTKRPFSGPWALISISTYSIRVDPVKKDAWHLVSSPYADHLQDDLKAIGCVDSLSLSFGDITPEHSDHGDDIQPMSVGDAEAVLGFVRRHPEIDFLVHCDAGVSRSGAVGLWMCRHFGQDEKSFIKAHRDVLQPNQHVLDLMGKVSGESAAYVAWWTSGKD